MSEEGIQARARAEKLVQTWAQSFTTALHRDVAGVARERLVELLAEEFVALAEGEAKTERDERERLGRKVEYLQGVERAFLSLLAAMRTLESSAVIAATALEGQSSICECGENLTATVHVDTGWDRWHKFRSRSSVPDSRISDAATETEKHESPICKAGKLVQVGPGPFDVVCEHAGPTEARVEPERCNHKSLAGWKCGLRTDHAGAHEQVPMMPEPSR